MRQAGTTPLYCALYDPAQPLTDSASDYAVVLAQVGQVRVVLLGEAMSGSHALCAERAPITRRLFEEPGFTAVAVEADWPDAYRVNHYVRGLGADQHAIEALAGFTRFPTWMWRNADELKFVGWLRAHNQTTARPVGFYGLELYSLYALIEALCFLLRCEERHVRRRTV